MPSVKTKLFLSSMAGAPALSGSVGAMLGVLDACLINGFNLLTLDSLVVASNVATATKNGHAYVVNQVVIISGASPAGVNGEYVVTEVAANTFKFQTSGITDQTATGTITAKAAPAGWEKQFSGTNLAVYRSGDLLSTRVPIKVDDTVGQYSSVLLAEGFTDISTPVNSCGTQYFKKSSSTDATARPWILIADAKTFYLGVDWNSAGTYEMVSFGDFTSIAVGDGFNARLQGLNSSAPANKGQYSSMATAWIEDSGWMPYSLIPRNYAQIIGVAPCYQGSLTAVSMTNSGLYSWAVSGNHGYQSTVDQYPFATPGAADSGYHFVPVHLFEKPVIGRVLRGVARGLLHILEKNPITSGYSLLSGVENIQGGRVLMIATLGYVAQNNTPAFIYPQAVIAISLGDW